MNLLAKFLKKEKKQTETNEVAFVAKTEKKKNPRSWYHQMARRDIFKNRESLDEAINRLFPRKPSDLVAVSSKTGVVLDSAIKPAMYNNDLPEEMIPFFTRTFIGWQACALLYENPYIKKACEIPARDAIAVDYVLQYENGDDGDSDTDKKKEQDVLNFLKRRSDKEMKIKDLVRDAEIFKNVYGQILVVPVFSKKIDMSKPFKIDQIPKNSYKGLALIQPFWLTYQMSMDGVQNPQMAGFYEPEYYIVNGDKKIHKSWVIKLTTGVCPDILKPVYYYGSIPLTQQIYERVFCAEKTANEAPKLALTKRLLVIDGQVENLTANPEEAYDVLEKVLEVRDNMGLMIKNPDDTVSQIDTSLTDFDALIMTQFQLVAAIAEMPATKLMKTQLKGLANSGDYEMKDYAQKLVEIQDNDFNRILELHYKLLSWSEYGKDLGLQVVWNPIDTPSEKEKAEIEQIQANTDSVYVSSGVVDASEVRQSLRADENSRFHNLPEEMPEMNEDDLKMEEMEEKGDENA